MPAGRRARRWTGRALLLSLPVAALLLLEGIARLTPTPSRPAFQLAPYFRPLHDDHGELVRDASGEVLYAADGAMARLWQNEGVEQRHCTRPKRAGTLRIFTLGASTTYGLGYAPDASFSRFLAERLRVLSPGQTIEVVNTGINGFDSDQLPALTRELMAFAPDLMILYAGHNELKYPHLARILNPARFGLFRALSRSVLLRRLIQPTPAVALPAVVSEGLLGEEHWQRAEAQFRRALEAIAGTCNDHRVPLMLCEPVSNILDKEPRLTVLTGNDARAERDRGDLLRAFLELCSGERTREELVPANVDVAAADRLLTGLLERFPEASLAHFLRGRLQLSRGEDAPARGSFQRSLETDALPERAAPRLVAVLRDVAEREHVPFVPLSPRFTAEARRGVPGNDLFLDYCHPTLFGHWLIADEVLRALEAERLLPGGPFAWETEAAEAGATPLFDHYAARIGISEQSQSDQLIDLARAKIGEALAKVEPERGRLMAAAREMVQAALQMQAGSGHGALVLAIVEGYAGRAEVCWELLQRAHERAPELTVDYARRIAGHPPLRDLFAAVGIGVQGDQFCRLP